MNDTVRSPPARAGDVRRASGELSEVRAAGAQRCTSERPFSAIFLPFEVRPSGSGVHAPSRHRASRSRARPVSSYRVRRVLRAQGRRRRKPPECRPAVEFLRARAVGGGVVGPAEGRCTGSSSTGVILEACIDFSGRHRAKIVGDFDGLTRRGRRPQTPRNQFSFSAALLRSLAVRWRFGRNVGTQLREDATLQVRARR